MKYCSQCGSRMDGHDAFCPDSARSADKEYLHPSHNTYCKAADPLSYGRCEDGIVVYGGTLPKSGFADSWDGITLPAEIDGLPVTELRGTYHEYMRGFRGRIDFIDAPNLKRVYLRLEGTTLNCRCSPHDPHFCLSDHNKIELIELELFAKNNTLSDFSNSKAIRKLNFQGTVHGEWNRCFFGDSLYVFYNEFSGCTNLKEVRGKFEADRAGGLFSGCTSLVTAPELNVEELKGTFFNCSSLRSVRLGDRVKTIGDRTFSGCSSLPDLFIPDKVEKIGRYAFENCTQLRSIHMPGRITSISEGLFSGCSNLRKVFLSDEIVSIEAKAFENCTSLVSPWIPPKLKKIGSRAFAGCTSLGRVFMPASIEEIGEEVFNYCPNLVLVCIEGSFAHRFAVKNHLRYKLENG